MADKSVSIIFTIVGISSSNTWFRYHSTRGQNRSRYRNRNRKRFVPILFFRDRFCSGKFLGKRFDCLGPISPPQIILAGNFEILKFWLKSVELFCCKLAPNKELVSNFSLDGAQIYSRHRLEQWTEALIASIEPI